MEGLAAQGGNKPMTAAEIKTQVQIIQEIMKAVMIKDVHYGIIPGTPKPTLYKPGSEKILATFHIAADPRVIEDLSTDDEIRYRVKTYGVSYDGCDVYGVGIGECSSSEEKYKWRKPVCDEEFNETPDNRKREAWKRGKDKNYQQKQVRTNPSDVANTILKMAKKRSQIDMTLTTTAASDVFEQDLEDLPDEVRDEVTKQEPKKEPPKQPQSKSSAEIHSVNFIPQEVTQKIIKKKGGGDLTKYFIKGPDAEYTTFSESFAKAAHEAKENDALIGITYKTTQWGNDIETLGEAVYGE